MQSRPVYYVQNPPVSPFKKGGLRKSYKKENTMTKTNILAEFHNPPREFSLLPFWFWNDDLDEQEILRQIADFEAHGVYGFVIHPRVGLPRDIGWMSERMMYFMRIAVEEAARRKMSVVLYDEGMYPSGSSSGQVVAENPDFACRCLALDDSADAKVLLREDANLIAEVETHRGQKLTIVDRKVASSIRGLHYIGEGPEEDAPPAADLLNPQAMDCFVRLVYERYAEYLGEWFGSTIIGVFTDEPGLLGKCEEKNVWPGTMGILEHVNRILGYDFTPHLPALWFADEPDAERYRADYKRAVKKRLEETYYAKLSSWCAAHGVALMGHPSEPDDIGVEKYFHIPGQDLVWRYVVPNSPSALEGEQSTQAKCSSSAMLHHGRRRNSNECFGAYGHNFTEQEMQWIADWCFVRGVNMLLPHAFYYSVRGPRLDERPPDVGPNSAWWNDYEKFATYCRRLCWLNTDSEHICNVAILGEADRLPWRAAKVLFQHQRDFNYLETRDLTMAEVNKNGIFINGMHYEALVLEGEYALNAEEEAALNMLKQSGRVLVYDDNQRIPPCKGGLRRILEDNNNSNTFAETATSKIPPAPLYKGEYAIAFIDELDRIAPRDLSLSPHHSDLRYRHVRKNGFDFYLLFNEGAQEIEGELQFANANELLWLDVFSAELTPATNRKLQLSPHQTTVVCMKSTFASLEA